MISAKLKPSITLPVPALKPNSSRTVIRVVIEVSRVRESVWLIETSRISENLPRMKGSLADVIDASINQTLSRTLLTSITTLVTVLVLLAFNFNTRNVLEGFAFALTIGVLVGTYSSMFVACPVLHWLETRRRRKDGEAAEAAAASESKPEPQVQTT